MPKRAITRTEPQPVGTPEATTEQTVDNDEFHSSNDPFRQADKAAVTGAYRYTDWALI